MQKENSLWRVLEEEKSVVAGNKNNRSCCIEQAEGPGCARAASTGRTDIFKGGAPVLRPYGAALRSGFTLIELLVVVLIMGILAAVALPQYRLAVDKARYAALIPVTKALAEAQERAILAGNTTSSFDVLDVALPGGCVGDNLKLSCNNGKWGCRLHDTQPYPRCSDLQIQATFYYLGVNRRICYAHTTDTSDRPNHLCQALTGKKTPFVTEPIMLFTGAYIPMNGYQFD